MTDNKQTHFKKLKDIEKKNKLYVFARSKVNFTIWEKSRQPKETFKPDHFYSDSDKLVLHPVDSSELVDKEVLYSFNLNGLTFFGVGKLIFDNNNYILVCHKDLYKSERRQSYRLLTYPHMNVFTSLNINKKEVETSNVVSLKTKLSETGIFKNFLSMIGDDANDSSLNKFRVLDISVTGMGIMLGNLEKELLENFEEVENITIFFENEIIKIPAAQICYIMDSKETDLYSYKAGINFKGIDINLDNKLGMLINRSLRDSDKEFEDFVN
ncbi:MAG: hypothetical protein N4A33_08020 [Bacteriovoracaceae bacterium]|jgi:hypothetical protein|nr:hypothetical protein [Bacteriovoracaceae bacterium]